MGYMYVGYKEMDEAVLKANEKKMLEQTLPYLEAKLKSPLDSHGCPHCPDGEKAAFGGLGHLEGEIHDKYQHGFGFYVSGTYSASTLCRFAVL